MAVHRRLVGLFAAAALVLPVTPSASGAAAAPAPARVAPATAAPPPTAPVTTPSDVVPPGVLDQGTDVLRRTTAARITGEHRVLFVRAYWGKTVPSRPSVTRVKTDVKAAADWYTTASYGQFTWRTPKVVPWLKIKKPAYCTDYGAITNRVVAGLKKRGISTKGWHHVVMYVPCTSYYAGQGSWPGRAIWLYGNTLPNVIAHEGLHNLGLGHGNSRTCTANGTPSTFRGQCQVSEYGDDHDVMGMGDIGNLAPPARVRLGWMRGLKSITSSASVTLRPLGSRVKGPRGLRVRTGKGDYWVNYRNGAGLDLPSEWRIPAKGVHVHLKGPDVSTQVVDGTPFLSAEGDNGFAIPVGSSITTPAGVRIRVLSEADDTARVQVVYGFGKPRVPAAPTVTATPGGYSASLSWTRPDDRGATISGYLVQSTDGTVSRRVNSIGGTVTTTVFGNLEPRPYQFTVQAINEVGRSAAGNSGTVSPVRKGATAEINSPWDGDELTGVTQIWAQVTPDARSPRDVAGVEFLVDGQVIGSATPDVDGGWFMDWDSRTVPDGPHTLTARVTEVGGTSTVSPPVGITVLTPVLTVLSPQPGSTVGDRVTVTWSGTHLDRIAYGIEIYWNDQYLTWADGPDGLAEIDLSWLDPGPGTLTLRSSWGDEFRPVSVPLTLARP